MTFEEQPQDGQDIATSWNPSAVQLIGLNTCNGCGVTPFDGQLAAIGCSGNSGVVTASAGGTLLHYHKDLWQRFRNHKDHGFWLRFE